MSFYHDDPVDESGPRNSIFSGALALVLLLAGGIFFLQSTLAANISLNSGGTIEFGQAVSQAVACSGSQNVIVTPKSSFVNAANGTGTYYLGSITVSDIPDSCYGADFKLSAFGTSSSTPLAIFNTTSTEAVVYDNAGTFEIGTGGSGTSLTQSTGTFTVSFSTPVTQSTTVAKVTIQSGVHKPLKFGDQGPAGGIIFMTPTTLGGSGGSYFYEMSPVDISSGAKICDSSHPLNLPSTIGSGISNTAAIIAAGCTSGAANLSDAYVYNGFADWFLPSADETIQICKYARFALLETGISTNCSFGTPWRPGFGGEYTTSTSGSNAGYAMHITFQYGAQYIGAQSTYDVRAVRSYLP